MTTAISESNNPTMFPKTPERKLGKSCSQHRAQEDTSPGTDPFLTLPGPRGISCAPPPTPRKTSPGCLQGSSPPPWPSQEELAFQLVRHHSEGNSSLFPLEGQGPAGRPGRDSTLSLHRYSRPSCRPPRTTAERHRSPEAYSRTMSLQRPGPEGVNSPTSTPRTRAGTTEHWPLLSSLKNSGLLTEPCWKPRQGTFLPPPPRPVWSSDKMLPVPGLGRLYGSEA